MNFSHATSINARGWATGGSFTAANDPLTGGETEHAVLWKDGEIIDIGTLLPGVESAGLYVNNGGEVVGFSTVDTTPDPFASIGLSPFASTLYPHPGPITPISHGTISLSWNGWSARRTADIENRTDLPL